ncbi:hypothetical protein OUZ56_020436 [Daphnia magna]|uniref:PPPDE domain-containing protein n=1 Tax=Daphnia magna TaxID=35525 RepID=A0ABQ9ZFI3_9CRUS|nr:hypothetical protein OUZ56_020436 [Daphnia magna]
MWSSKICAAVGSKFTKKLYFDPYADKSSTGGYWITDEEFRKKLANLIDTEERIKNASVYSHPLSSWQLTNAKAYHAFIIMETNDWWWSIEKNMERITIQRSKYLKSVRDMYQRKKRTTGKTSGLEIHKDKTTQGNDITINELINYIWRKDCLNNIYHLLDANCQDFADMVFYRIQYPYDTVYFDEAADQHDNDADSTSGFYMTVDKALDEVRRCGGSEPFTEHLESYKLRISFKQYFCNYYLNQYSILKLRLLI